MLVRHELDRTSKVMMAILSVMTAVTNRGKYDHYLRQPGSGNMDWFSGARMQRVYAVFKNFARYSILQHISKGVGKRTLKAGANIAMIWQVEIKLSKTITFHGNEAGGWFASTGKKNSAWRGRRMSENLGFNSAKRQRCTLQPVVVEWRERWVNCSKSVHT